MFQAYSSLSRREIIKTMRAQRVAEFADREVCELRERVVVRLEIPACQIEDGAGDCVPLFTRSINDFLSNEGVADRPRDFVALDAVVGRLRFNLFISLVRRGHSLLLKRRASRVESVERVLDVVAYYFRLN